MSANQPVRQKAKEVLSTLHWYLLNFTELLSKTSPIYRPPLVMLRTDWRIRLTHLIGSRGHWSVPIPEPGCRLPWTTLTWECNASVDHFYVLGLKYVPPFSPNLWTTLVDLFNKQRIWSWSLWTSNWFMNHILWDWSIDHSSEHNFQTTFVHPQFHK